jgi:hypothetical protein
MRIAGAGKPETAFNDEHVGGEARVYGQRGFVASLAILADDRRSWRPDGYGFELFGCVGTIAQVGRGVRGVQQTLRRPDPDSIAWPRGGCGAE